MSTYKAVVLKGRVHEKSDGSTNIKIRITHARAVNYIPTDLYILPADFDNRQGIATKGRNVEFINMRITDILHTYRKKDIELGEKRNLMSVADIKRFLLKKDENPNQIDFFDFYNEFIKSVESKGTIRWHRSCVDNLKKFVGKKLPFAHINPLFLMRFESYMRSNGVDNGVNNAMRSFRALFNKAKEHYNEEDFGLIKIPHSPFQKYKIPQASVRSKEHTLTLHEMMKFINYNPCNSGEEFAKDMFLLMFFLIGIEAKDLFYLNNEVNGRVSYDRFKTGKEYSIKLEHEALLIIEKYKGRERLLDVIDRYTEHDTFIAFVNNQLHGSESRRVSGIFPKLGIKKAVTTKWAKHTWATLARNNCRINKDDVALCLGHEDSDNKVTDMYVKYDYSIIDKSNRMVLDLLN